MSMAVKVPEGKSGDWRVERFVVSEEDARWDRVRGFMHGGRSCPAGRYTRLMRGSTIVMSDTPDEQRDHQWPVLEAKERGGRVLINGLGIGMVAQAILNLPNVEHVDIVEISADVIALTGPHLQKKFGKRLTIHHADCLEQCSKWKRGARWTVAWHDIWDAICSDNLEEMSKLKRSYGRRVEWQGCWAEWLCKRSR